MNKGHVSDYIGANYDAFGVNDGSVPYKRKNDSIFMGDNREVKLQSYNYGLMVSEIVSEMDNLTSLALQSDDLVFSEAEPTWTDSESEEEDDAVIKSRNNADGANSYGRKKKEKRSDILCIYIYISVPLRNFILFSYYFHIIYISSIYLDTFSPRKLPYQLTLSSWHSNENDDSDFVEPIVNIGKLSRNELPELRLRGYTCDPMLSTIKPNKSEYSSFRNTPRARLGFTDRDTTIGNGIFSSMTTDSASEDDSNSSNSSIESFKTTSSSKSCTVEETARRFNVERDTWTTDTLSQSKVEVGSSKAKDTSSNSVYSSVSSSNLTNKSSRGSNNGRDLLGASDITTITSGRNSHHSTSSSETIYFSKSYSNSVTKNAIVQPSLRSADVVTRNKNRNNAQLNNAKVNKTTTSTLLSKTSQSPIASNVNHAKRSMATTTSSNS